VFTCQPLVHDFNFKLLLIGWNLSMGVVQADFTCQTHFISSCRCLCHWLICGQEIRLILQPPVTNIQNVICKEHTSLFKGFFASYIRARAPLELFNWELFDYPPHISDLGTSDYHMFTYLKMLFKITSLQQQWFDGMCQNTAELTGDRLLWHRHTETCSP
jgi:hypothetical protein